MPLHPSKIDQFRETVERVQAWSRQNNSSEYYHNAPYAWWRTAKDNGVITAEEYDIAREYYGTMWNYVGD